MLPRGSNNQTSNVPSVSKAGPYLTSSITPVSASTLPLPVGAATEATITTINTTLGSPMQATGGSVTANAGTNLNTSALNLETTQSAFKTANHTDLAAINTTLGSPLQQSGGTVTIKTPTVTLTHTNITTSNSSQQALASNSNTKYRLFQNIDSTNSLTIAFGVTAVASTQIVLFPKEKISFSLSDSNLDTRVVNCIANAGTPVLLITEGV